MLSANQSTLQVFLKTAINITKIVICERILVPLNIDVTFFCLQENQCPTNCLKYWLILIQAMQIAANLICLFLIFYWFNWISRSKFILIWFHCFLIYSFKQCKWLLILYASFRSFTDSIGLVKETLFWYDYIVSWFISICSLALRR